MNLKGNLYNRSISQQLYVEELNSRFFLLISSTCLGRTCYFETREETGAETSIACWIVTIFRDSAQKNTSGGKREWNTKEYVELTSSVKWFESTENIWNCAHTSQLSVFHISNFACLTSKKEQLRGKCTITEEKEAAHQQSVLTCGLYYGKSRWNLN